MIKNHRVEELQDYFKTHNKSKEQKAHTSKVSKSVGNVGTNVDTNFNKKKTSLIEKEKLQT